MGSMTRTSAGRNRCTRCSMPMNSTPSSPGRRAIDAIGDESVALLEQRISQRGVQPRLAALRGALDRAVLLEQQLGRLGAHDLGAARDQRLEQAVVSAALTRKVCDDLALAPATGSPS